MPFDGVIFDMDGVMIDSEPLWAEAAAEFLARRGKVFDPAIVNKLRGKTQTECMQIYKKQYAIEGDSKEMVEEKKALVKKKFHGRLRCMEGLSEFLQFLEKKKLKLVVASGSPQDIIDFVLDNFQLGDYFQASLSGDLVGKGKPHPYVFLKAAEMIGVQPDRCLVIEDSVYGVQAGKRAGMKVAGFLSTLTKADLHEADVHVTGFADLMARWPLE